MKKKALPLLAFVLSNLFALKSSGQECSGCSGVNQSPVEIANAIPLTRAMKLDISKSKKPLETAYAQDPVTNKAINIEAELSHHDKSYFITLNNISYKFSNVHFHLHSEHKLDNRFYDMEAHFVFKSDKASEGAVVIGMLINKASKGHAAFAILDSLVQGIQYTAQTLPDTNSYHFSSSVNPDAFMLDRFLKGGYYSYTGSLTTPKYSEGITWIVLSQSEYIDAAYYNMFSTIQSRYQFGKARDLQPINNRIIVSAAAGK